MNYRATKIRVTCDEEVVREWASYMLAHIDEVSLALRNEGVRHEMWFMSRDSSLFIIGVMDVESLAASKAIAANSRLSVDERHRRFKDFWDRSSFETLPIDPAKAPSFEACELLLEARP
ncbi:DUF6176 family protein [Pseudaminobacter soli (ex Li et al. 2025)]|uniref:DUF4286 family protein n=1 Tax=Pseudaminobacter soli (ex Li et al. 2025) TaxID=1295366 RepID=A0A2P7SGE0_9HYPH|nr:DUF6176 family protein [Mesorhizobium soli]PSJ61559.1 hypothetical protein C7I85_10985 [Mesorhizobium soli]